MVFCGIACFFDGCLQFGTKKRKEKNCWQNECKKIISEFDENWKKATTKKKKAKENWPNPVVSNLCRLFPNSTHNFTISDLAECFTNLNKVYNFKGNSTHVLYTVSLNYFGRKCCYSSPLEGTLPMWMWRFSLKQNRNLF